MVVCEVWCMMRRSIASADQPRARRVLTAWLTAWRMVTAELFTGSVYMIAPPCGSFVALATHRLWYLPSE
jgi:hypothetical protein